MSDNTRKPDVRRTKTFYLLKCLLIEIVELTTSILLQCTIAFAGGVTIPEKTGKHLIDNRFHSIR